MPRCRAKANGKGNAVVQVDNGVTLTENSNINIDTTKALAKAAVEAGTVEELDATAAPKYPELPAAGSTI